jgi:hypothetical protein
MDVHSAKRASPGRAEVDVLYKKLLAAAWRLFRGMGCSDVDSMLPGTGMSAKDLAAGTLLNLLEKGMMLPDEDMFPLAYRIMKCDFLDLIKSPDYKQTQIIDSIDGEHGQQGIENIPSPNNGMEPAEAALLTNSLQRLLGSDEMLKAYLDVLLIKGLESRADQAEALGVSEQEVTNLRRRLAYKTNLWIRVFANARPAGRKKGGVEWLKESRCPRGNNWKGSLRVCFRQMKRWMK